MTLRVTRRAAEPRDLLAALRESDAATRFYWRSADGSVELLGLGEAAAFETSGPERLQRAARLASDSWRGLEVDGVEAPREAGPLLVGGFGFWDEAAAEPEWRGFPALRFWVPEVLWAQIGEATFRTESRDTRVPAREPTRAERAACAERVPRSGFSARAEPSQADFERAVARATHAIDAGLLEKVVLARACLLSQAGGFDAASVLRALREAQPGCFLYGVGLGGASFVGASPERLLRRDGAEVRADALAGSAPRGRTPDEDTERARALLASAKEREEHAIVRRAVLGSLGKHCSELRAPDAPALLRLAGIQHLHTPVSGRVTPGAEPSVLELAAELFPTPAVGGAPRAAALEFLRRHESARRGWYSGAIGWVTPSGEGELCVALRSALLRGDAATLHAGVGIVAGSTPQAELAETRWKLASALGALVEL